MWVLRGPFDGQESGALNFQVPKLVEADKRYSLGRKDAALIINHKKISKEHCDFLTGPATDVSDPNSRLVIQVVNKRDKVLLVSRRGEEIPVNPASVFDLQHEDDVVVSNNVVVSVTWVPVCCYVAPSKSKLNLPLSECATLGKFRTGIHVVRTLDAPITHHLTPQFIANRASAVSLLLASCFVRPEWLTELVRMGTSTPNKPVSALEKSFSLPSTTKFRPAFSPSLGSSSKSFNAWEPNEARIDMFHGRRFLFIVDAGQIDPDLRRVIEKGKGAYATFMAGSGRAALAKQLGKMLSQAESDVTRIVVVADVGAVKTAVGASEWNELETEVTGLGIQVKKEEDIIHSVLRADLKGLVDDASQSMSQSSLPSIIPNSISDELSSTQTKRRSMNNKAGSQELDEIPQPSRTSLKRRAPSKAPEGSKDASLPSPEPEEPPRKKFARRAPSHTESPPPPQKSETIEIDDSPPPPPRRPLRRRVGTRGTTPVIGIDDPSTVLEAEPLITPSIDDMPPPTQPMIDLTAPTQARTSRLKRRAQTQQQSEATTSSMEPVIASSEPVLQQYKALFDASHPTSQHPPALEPIMELMDDDSQTQSQTQAGRDSRGGTIAAREEEESQTQPQGALRGKKRPRIADDDGDIEMVEDGAEIQRPLAKKRALARDENVSPPTTAATKKPSSTAQAFKASDRPDSNEPSKMDKDEAFLKAISKKRGKKKDDEILDREFNNLRIAKPDLAEENEDDQRRILEEFGDEDEVRGNFMVVLEMDVSLRREPWLDDRSNADWAGQPNFKKFKKKVAPGEQKRRGIDLVLTEPSDFGTGPAYWQSQSQPGKSDDDEREMNSPVKPAKTSKSQTKRKIIAESDSDGDGEVTLDIPPKVPEKRGKNVGKAKKPPSSTLFLEDSEDEIQEVEEPKPVARPSRTTSKRPAARKAAIIVEDSDDETAFKGFGSRKR